MADQDMSKIPFKQRVTMAQKALKAPKNQYNNFGKYKYRSAEDILEAVKPINDEYHLTLILTDDIEIKGERTYLKTTATLLDPHSDESLSVTALAREPQARKGMDESQITGGASSYARKYALNGLYLIDDTKEDPDVQQPHQQKSSKSSQRQKSTQKNQSQKQDQTTNKNTGFEQTKKNLLGRIRSMEKDIGTEEGEVLNYIYSKVVDSNGPATDITPNNYQLISDLADDIAKQKGL